MINLLTGLAQTVSMTDAVSLTDAVSATDAAAGASVISSSPSFFLKLIGIVLTGIFTQNFVLNKFLGCCPFLGVSKKVKTALGMSGAVIFVMVLATLVTYPIYALLASKGLEFMETLVFILVIAALVQLVEIVLKKFMPALYESLGVYLPLITTNCAVLGVTMLVIDDYFSPRGAFTGADYLSAVLAALGAGIGFMVAMLLFAGVRERLEESDIPDFMKGLPITLVSASIVALSFMGFAGLIEGLGLA